MGKPKAIPSKPPEHANAVDRVRSVGGNQVADNFGGVDIAIGPVSAIKICARLTTYISYSSSSFRGMILRLHAAQSVAAMNSTSERKPWLDVNTKNAGKDSTYVMPPHINIKSIYP